VAIGFRLLDCPRLTISSGSPCLATTKSDELIEVWNGVDCPVGDVCVGGLVVFVGG